MVRIGIAGIGFMGVTHYKAIAAVTGAQVAAICTRSRKKRDGDWNDVKGNFGDTGGVHDLSRISRYENLRDLFVDDRLDLIDICLPTPMHMPMAIEALEAGKHVLVEKPIALTVTDADRMIAAAEANGRLLMVGQVLRLCPQWAYLKKAIDHAQFGRLTTFNLRRVITLPDWSEQIADFSANGGPLIDLHIHDVDFLLYLLGKPKRLASIGRRRGDCVVFVSTIYDYGDGPTVSCQGGAVSMRGRPFLHEYEACFERATVTFAEATEPHGNDPTARRSASQVLTLYDADGGVSFPQFGEPNGFVAQFEHVVECVTANWPSRIIGAETARDSLAVVLLEAKSIERGGYVDVKVQ